jgi:hypothetical protein
MSIRFAAAICVARDMSLFQSTKLRALVAEDVLGGAQVASGRLLE